MSTQDSFAYRCARIQTYIQTYLHPKNVTSLIVSNICRGTPTYNGAVLNYLFKYERAGTELYDAAPTIDGVLIIITKSQFYWFVDDISGVQYLTKFIDGLTNHSITCGHTLQVLSSQQKYALNCGEQVTEQEYQQDFKIAQKYVGKQLPKDCTIQLPILNDVQNVISWQVFLDKFLSNQATVAFAGPTSEEQMITDYVSKTAKIAAVQQSLLQLVYGHVDATCFHSLKTASSQLKRQYAEIIQNIDQADTIVTQLHQFLPPNAEQQLPKPSSIKFNPTLNQDKKQIGKAGIYDIYLSHPRIPIIYRQPYIYESENLKSFQLVGFICCFMSKAFIYLNQLLKEKEEKVGEQFREYLKAQLLKDQPTEFVEPLMQLVNQLKLNVELYQLDGQKIFGRQIQCIQVACQLKYRNLETQNYEVQTLLFGRSYISTPDGFLNINDLGEIRNSLFDVNERLGITLGSTNYQKDEFSKIVDFNLGMLIYNKGVGEIVPIPQTFEANFKYQNFQMLLEAPFLKPIFCKIQNNQNSQKFAQLQNIQIENDEDENKMKPAFMRKKMYLCSHNLGLLLEKFGNFIFGWFCNEFVKYKNEDIELEGFCIEVDLKNKVNYNQVRKYIQEEMAADIVQMDLRDYKYVGPEFDDSIEETKEENKKEANPFIQSMMEHDMKYIFGQITDSDYSDKLLSKAGTQTPFGKGTFKQCYVLSYSPDQSALLQQNAILRHLMNHHYGSNIKLVEIESQQDMNSLVESIQQYNNTILIAICPAQLQQFVMCSLSNFFKSYTAIQMNNLEHNLNIFPINDYKTQFSDINSVLTHLIISDTNNINYAQYKPSFYTIQFDGIVQKFIDSESIHNALTQIKPYNYDNVKINQYITPDSQLQSNKKVLFTSKIELAQATLKKVSETLQRNASLFKGINEFIQIKFGKFQIEYYEQNLICELNPYCLINQNSIDEIQLISPNKLSSKIVNSLEIMFKTFVLFIQNEFGKQQQQQPVKIQEPQQQDAKWEEIRKYYKDEPLPSGWFPDCGRYMDWSGNISDDRPDKAELIIKYKTDVLKNKKK
ncbi:Conserved_hypothetical protein [Hexamita inflata]|uniref:Uncharacterized protein n=1 Tax=Hexamita inflata TaxID=28002 RepID=A0AA86NZ61_9EUKA|nr:Conserved hypothetical protein [Hexamita inflata]